MVPVTNSEADHTLFCGNCGSPYLGKTTVAARAALSIHTSVCCRFRVFAHCMATSVSDFLYWKCAQLLLHAVAHGDCAEHRKRICIESYLTADQTRCRVQYTAILQSILLYYNTAFDFSSDVYQRAKLFRLVIGWLVFCPDMTSVVDSTLIINWFRQFY